MRRYNIEELVQEIRNLGYDIKGYMELKKIGPNDKRVIPIMLSYLEKTDDLNQKEFIIRCLSVKGFSEITRCLLDEFKKEYSAEPFKLEDYRFSIGNALFLIEDNNSLHEMRGLAQDKQYGFGRIRIIEALGKLKDQKSIPILIDALQDPSVRTRAIVALSYFKDKSLSQYVEPLLLHENDEVRRQAKKAMKKWGRLGLVEEDPRSEVEPLTDDVPTSIVNQPLKEASSALDMGQLKPFLSTLIPLIESGFSESQVNRVMELVESMDVEEEKEVGNFQIKYNGRDTVLVIKVFMDDIDAPDLYVFTDPELADEILDLMETVNF